jgi:hypothetical protein
MIFPYTLGTNIYEKMSMERYYKIKIDWMRIIIQMNLSLRKQCNHKKKRTVSLNGKYSITIKTIVMDLKF